MRSAPCEDVWRLRFEPYPETGKLLDNLSGRLHIRRAHLRPLFQEQLDRRQARLRHAYDEDATAPGDRGWGFGIWALAWSNF